MLPELKSVAVSVITILADKPGKLAWGIVISSPTAKPVPAVTTLMSKTLPATETVIAKPVAFGLLVVISPLA